MEPCAVTLDLLPSSGNLFLFLLNFAELYPFPYYLSTTIFLDRNRGSFSKGNKVEIGFRLGWDGRKVKTSEYLGQILFFVHLRVQRNLWKTKRVLGEFKDSIIIEAKPNLLIVLL
jgi:hypothetical protein